MVSSVVYKLQMEVRSALRNVTDLTLALKALNIGLFANGTATHSRAGVYICVYISVHLVWCPGDGLNRGRPIAMGSGITLFTAFLGRLVLAV